MKKLFDNISKQTEQDDKAEQTIHDIKTKSSSYWAKEREQRALGLFHEAAERVPAYKDFLKKNKINPSRITTFEDFSNIPSISKENYLRRYSLEKLCWDGSLTKPLVFTATSGSTGEPFYFCRSSELDWQSSVIHELYFKNGLYSQNSSTLILVCFGMGVWIGGLITYQAFELMAKRGYPVSILTPGINKEEIFKALKNLAPNFDNVIIAGYPPFMKDVLDEAPSRGIKLKNLNIRLLFAAEAFTEKFRDYISKKVGISNPYLDTMNIYGSADIGTMAFETPLSILIRRLATQNKKLFEEIFSPISKTPTLAQYNPMFTTFEAKGGRLYITGDNSLPLIKYDIGDHGGTYSFNQLVEKFASHGISLLKEARAAGIDGSLYQLPFVYVYERADFSTTLYGLQIYPETIKEVLLEQPFHDYLTGKITLATRFDENQNQYLEINLELQKGKNVSKIVENQLLAKILNNLREKSSEFRELSRFLKDKVTPRLVFWPHEDTRYFKPGIKQKWVELQK
jgi:phenylacetate-CoA ligase